MQYILSGLRCQVNRGDKEAHLPAILRSAQPPWREKDGEQGNLMKPASKVRLAILVVLLAAGGAGVYFLPVKDWLAQFLDWLQTIGPWGPLLLGAIYVVACVLFVPGTILTLGAGFAFGVVVGTVTVSLASTLGATAAFLVGRTLARDWVQEKVARSPKFRALDEAVGRQGFKIVLLTRLSPLLPFNLLNYALGVTQVPLHTFVLASWIGMLPATVLYVYLGSTLKSLAEVVAGKAEGGVAQQLFFGVGLAATVVVTVFITRLASKSLKEAVALPRAEDKNHD